MEVSEHLFRREWGRLVAALVRVLGVHNLALAEDVAQEAFCRAIEVWGYRGAPENPRAWLLVTARNHAMDLLRRQRTARTMAPELTYHLQSESALATSVDEMLAPDAIKDDLLRMMFSCCQPQLPEASQIALVLNILCGFSVDEIAAALLGRHAGVEKRLTRAKKALAASEHLFDLASPAQLAARLPTVQRALYLLFNEGYHGACREGAVRSELCQEAMRLTAILLDHPLGATAKTCALAALMCLHAARLPGRVDAQGELRPLAEQDRSSWDAELIAEGLAFLARSACGARLSEYHIEAAIAACHTVPTDPARTDWATIASLYEALMALHPSPVVALNHAIAVGQLEGPERGLAQIAACQEHEPLAAYPFYHAALGELQLRRGCPAEAQRHFQDAIAVARSPMERAFLERRRQASQTQTSEPADPS